MEKTSVFEGEAQEEKKNYENQPIEESQEDGEIVSEEQSCEQIAPVQKVETVSEVRTETAPPAEVGAKWIHKIVSEVPVETAADEEAKTEPKDVTEDSGFASFSADSTTELKTAIGEEKEEGNTPETNPLGKEPERLRKLFVAGLPNGAKIEDIEKALGEFYVRFGEVESVFVAYVKQSGVSLGYGFVTFTTKAAVDAVISSRPHTVAGQQVCEKRATPKGNGTIDTNALFVTGITESVDETALSTHFTKYGTVDSVKIHTDPVTLKPRGFAFVNFAVSDSADQCVLDSRWHVISGIQVTAEKAVPKKPQNQRDRNFRAQRCRDPADRRNSGSGRGWGMGTMPPPQFYPPPFGAQYPPMVRENQNLAYRAAAGADRSDYSYPLPLPVRAFLNEMAATAAMGQAFHANQRPPTQQRRSGGGPGGPIGQGRGGRWDDSYY